MHTNGRSAIGQSVSTLPEKEIPANMAIAVAHMDRVS
jgi:hypothetical protein